jgi:murein DD-endopeptidase MepM/ murein hydrolase activator NlpD
MNTELLRAFCQSGKIERGPILEPRWYEHPWAEILLTEEDRNLPIWDLNDVQGCTEMVFSHLHQSGYEVGYGGYGETRGAYAQSEHFQKEGRARSVHIGIDIFVPAGTSILAPLAGKVHSFQENNNHLDYGPTVILEHRYKDETWYSLYGHLSRSSLEGLSEGTPIGIGDKLATIGKGTENGGWVPHLHFQLMFDLEDWCGDYPGVCFPEERERYLANCPDPAIVLEPELKRLPHV